MKHLTIFYTILMLGFLLPAVYFAQADEEPTKHYSYYYTQGMNDYFAKEHELALESFSQVITVNPDFGMAYYYRAICQAELGKFEAAAEDFQDFSQIVTNPPPRIVREMRMLRGKAYGYAGMHHLALMDLNVLVEEDKKQEEEGTTPLIGKNFDVYLLRGDILYQMGDLFAAENDYNTALERASNNTERAKVKARQARVFFDRLQIANAILTIHDATQMDPENSQYQTMLNYYMNFYPVETTTERSEDVYPDDYGRLSESR